MERTRLSLGLLRLRTLSVLFRTAAFPLPRETSAEKPFSGRRAESRS